MSAFDQQGKFTPHARKTSGTQGIIRRAGVIKVKTEGYLLTASATGRGEGKKNRRSVTSLETTETSFFYFSFSRACFTRCRSFLRSELLMRPLHRPGF